MARIVKTPCYLKVWLATSTQQRQHVDLARIFAANLHNFSLRTIARACHGCRISWKRIFQNQGLEGAHWNSTRVMHKSFDPSTTTDTEAAPKTFEFPFLISNSRINCEQIIRTVIFAANDALVSVETRRQHNWLIDHQTFWLKVSSKRHNRGIIFFDKKGKSWVCHLNNETHSLAREVTKSIFFGFSLLAAFVGFAIFAFDPILFARTSLDESRKACSHQSVNRVSGNNADGIAFVRFLWLDASEDCANHNFSFTELEMDHLFDSRRLVQSTSSQKGRLQFSQSPADASKTKLIRLFHSPSHSDTIRYLRFCSPSFTIFLL